MSNMCKYNFECKFIFTKCASRKKAAASSTSDEWYFSMSKHLYIFNKYRYIYSYVCKCFDFTYKYKYLNFDTDRMSSIFVLMKIH